MKPKALVISPSADEAHVGFGDAKSVAIGFKRAGYAVDFVSQKELTSGETEIAIGSYSLICYEPPRNALHFSTPSNFEFFTKLHREARDGALTLHYCDLSFPLDPNIWNPKMGRDKSKINLMAGRPVRIMGSFSSDILRDAQAMDLIRKRVLTKMHPDSSFVPLEWNTLNYARVAEDGGFQDTPRVQHLQYDNFYYGLDKRKLVPSLKRLGLGGSVNDAVLGSISKAFPGVKNVQQHGGSGGREPWLPHALLARRILIPYERIKGDYQATLRFLEALMFYPDRAVLDPQIADWMQPMASEHGPWKQRVAETVDRMVDLHLNQVSAFTLETSPLPPEVANLTLSPLTQPRRNAMAGGIYKLTVLEPTEGEPKEELLSDLQLVERFAPALETGKPSHSKLIEEWIHAFTTVEVLQTVAGVKLEKKDSKEVFDEREKSYAQAKKDYKETASALSDALVSVLSDITEEEIAEGEIHKLGTRSLGIIEYYTAKITPTPVKGILEKHESHLPKHVVKALRAIQDSNRKTTEKKFGAKSGS